MTDPKDSGNRLRQNTQDEIGKVGAMRKKIAELEGYGIPRQHDDFLDLRDQVHELLDLLLIDELVDMETSSLIRNKLKRIDSLFREMEGDGNYLNDGDGEQLKFDKEKQDSKLHVVQLMLSQIFPTLREAI